MSFLLDITANDIALLDDKDLRELVARLCEAEVRKRGFGTSCVTWGGNQNAADGGIDVRVALPSDAIIDGFVPRPAAGFQVKRQEMPRGEILEEMRLKDGVRPSIQRLADQAGAYIIVSLESTTDSMYDSRVKAMRETVEGMPNANVLALDFYDRTRVATWVRSHEGLIAWVRETIGKPIPGWHSYGSWAYAPAPVTAEYLLDDGLRVHASRSETATGMSALHGIEKMRSLLREPQQVARLVGLSGVGKTRLVQALFDDRIGEDSLDPSLAFYANMADGPEPHPIALASRLIAIRTRAILVIDNCPPELHQRLSELCRQPDSKVSVITVEYDIREDRPEGTEVFMLEPSSPELIERLIRKRFTNLSEIDARTVAEFSGGNARIAIALAATIGKRETVAGLPDEQLFQRLILQGRAPDEALYLAAQACSLVYSFQGEDVSDAQDSELGRLAKLIEKTPLEVRRSVAELQRRDLVQQRNVWRAVLPQAIADRLAVAALQNVPYAIIEQHLVKGAPDRLLRSFSRRLGYLHASREAEAIVKQWLRADGLLGNVAALDELGQTMLENVAPVAPEDVLVAIERALLGPGNQRAAKDCNKYLHLLRSIAYDRGLFDRAAALVAHIVVAGDADESSHAAQVFVSLFQLYLSGTLATIEQRLTVIEQLLYSTSTKHRALGVMALKSALQTGHFFSSARFTFGARSRDYGYAPRTSGEMQNWFRLTLRVVETVACSDRPAAPCVRAALAGQFRHLWHDGGIPDELARVCRAIAEVGFWPEGWIAVRQTLTFDGEGMNQDCRAQLAAVEAQLRPADLLEKVRSLVLTPHRDGVGLNDSEDDSTEDFQTRRAREEALLQDLGKAVARDEACLTEVLPELVSSDENFSLLLFGQGLQEGAADAEALWNRLVTAFRATHESSRRTRVLAGYLGQLYARNTPLANTLLDRALEDDTLARSYPILQIAVGIDHEGIARLRRSLALGRTPVEMYYALAHGRAAADIAAADLKEFLLTIAAMPSGHDVAVEILQMRLHSDKKRGGDIAPELIDAGRNLLFQVRFTKKNHCTDYRLGVIGKYCLVGEQGAAAVKEICRKLKRAVSTYETHSIYHDDLLDGFFRAQPTASLDGLCAGGAQELELGIRILSYVLSRKDLLAAVSEEDLLRWCDEDPQSRYPAIAGVITISQQASETEPLRWTNVALRLLEKAPDAGAVLEQFVDHLTPKSGWNGSLAAILEAKATLLDDLGAYPIVEAVIAQQKIRLQQAIESQRRRELAQDRQRDERFE